MNRRVALRALVKAGLLVVAAGFVAVFIRGLLGPERPADEVIELAGIPPGSARLVSWGGRAVWVVNRSGSQLEALAGPSSHVTDPGEGASDPIDPPYRSLEATYGIYLAETPRDGILVQYTLDRPSRLAAGVPWYGGFVDPGSEALFDMAGRRYQGTRGPPLAVPPHRFTRAGAVRLGEW